MARTRGLRRVIVGPQMPYFHGGYPMEAPGVGIGKLIDLQKMAVM